MTCLLQKEKGEKRGGEEDLQRKLGYFGFRERVCNFSLDLREIRPSAVFGTRRRTALRGEGFVWVPYFGSFLKLREVGVSPYLGLFFV